MPNRLAESDTKSKMLCKLKALSFITKIVLAITAVAVITGVVLGLLSIAHKATTTSLQPQPTPEMHEQSAELPSSASTNFGEHPSESPAPSDIADPPSDTRMEIEYIDWETAKGLLENLAAEYYEADELFETAENGVGFMATIYVRQRFLELATNVLMQPFSVQHDHPCLSYENGKFFIQSLDFTSYADRHYRLVKAGPFETFFGAGTALFLQWWDEDLQPYVMELDQFSHGELTETNLWNAKLTTAGDELNIQILNDEWFEEEKWEYRFIPVFRTFKLDLNKFEAFLAEASDVSRYTWRQGGYSWGYVDEQKYFMEPPVWSSVDKETQMYYIHALINNDEIYYIEEITAPLLTTEDSMSNKYLPVGKVVAYDPFLNTLRQFPDALVSACNYTIMDNLIFYTDYNRQKFTIMDLSGTVINEYDVAPLNFKVDESAVYYFDPHDGMIKKTTFSDGITTILSWTLIEGYVRYTNLYLHADFIEIRCSFMADYRGYDEEYSGLFYLKKDGSGYVIDRIFYDNDIFYINSKNYSVDFEKILPLTSAPTTLAALPKPDYTAVYKAYYAVLSEAVDMYGIGATPDPNLLDREAEFEKWIEKKQDRIYAGQGICFAELICFGDSLFPQLLYVYDIDYGPNRYICNVNVFGYSADAELYFSHHRGGDSGDYTYIYIVTDKNGVSYLLQVDSHDSIFDGGESYEIRTFLAVRNGQWIEVPEAEIDIASTRDCGYAYDPDTVHAVLEQLQSLL